MTARIIAAIQIIARIASGMAQIDRGGSSYLFPETDVSEAGPYGALVLRNACFAFQGVSGGSLHAAIHAVPVYVSPSVSDDILKGIACRLAPETGDGPAWAAADETFTVGELPVSAARYRIGAINRSAGTWVCGCAEIGDSESVLIFCWIYYAITRT